MKAYMKCGHRSTFSDEGTCILCDIEGVENGTKKECEHCNGYGSSLKEDSDRCSRCGGSGVVEVTSTP